MSTTESAAASDVQVVRSAIADIRDEWSESRAMGQDRSEWRTWRAVADLLEDAVEAHLTVRPGNYPHWLKALAVAQAHQGVTR